MPSLVLPPPRLVLPQLLVFWVSRNPIKASLRGALSSFAPVPCLALGFNVCLRIETAFAAAASN